MSPEPDASPAEGDQSESSSSTEAAPKTVSRAPTAPRSGRKPKKGLVGRASPVSREPLRPKSPERAATAPASIAGEEAAVSSEEVVEGAVEPVDEAVELTDGTAEAVELDDELVEPEENPVDKVDPGTDEAEPVVGEAEPVVDEAQPVVDESAADETGADEAAALREVMVAAVELPEPEQEQEPEQGLAPEREVEAPEPASASSVLTIEAVTKEFGITRAVDDLTLDIPAGALYGIVGPNGAGKTTLLSMITGLLRPDSGRITVNGHDVWDDPDSAKRVLGVLPDRLRLFDRLTGRQFLYYSGTLRGLDRETVRVRSAELAAAFGLDEALGRLVADYSAGMTKKVALAAAMIHSPRILVLDEPFEGVDPVSSQNVIDILQRFVNAGGTVLLSSHSMETLERICTRVAVIVRGELLAQGTVDEVSAEGSLEERFLELAGADNPAESMEWLLSSSG